MAARPAAPIVGYLIANLDVPGSRTELVRTVELSTPDSTIMSAPASNVPELAPGVFTVEDSILIDAPIEKVWEILLDFGSYGEW